MKVLEMKTVTPDPDFGDRYVTMVKLETEAEDDMLEEHEEVLLEPLGLHSNEVSYYMLSDEVTPAVGGVYITGDDIEWERIA